MDIEKRFELEHKTCNYLFDENERLNAIIDELEERIDKAIEFLHNNTMIGHCKEHYELLEILGDKK